MNLKINLDNLNKQQLNQFNRLNRMLEQAILS